MIDHDNKFVGVQFLLSSMQVSNGMCILCLRKSTHLVFYNILREGNHVNHVIQKYGNICNAPGEYHSSAMFICPPHGPVHSMTLEQRHDTLRQRHDDEHREDDTLSEHDRPERVAPLVVFDVTHGLTFDTVEFVDENAPDDVEQRHCPEDRRPRRERRTDHAGRGVGVDTEPLIVHVRDGGLRVQRRREARHVHPRPLATTLVSALHSTGTLLDNWFDTVLVVVENSVTGVARSSEA